MSELLAMKKQTYKLSDEWREAFGRTVCIYSLNGTLRSTLTLPQGESQIWINGPSIIR